MERLKSFVPIIILVIILVSIVKLASQNVGSQTNQTTQQQTSLKQKIFKYLGLTKPEIPEQNRSFEYVVPEKLGQDQQSVTNNQQPLASPAKPSPSPQIQKEPPIPEFLPLPQNTLGTQTMLTPPLPEELPKPLEVLSPEPKSTADTVKNFFGGILTYLTGKPL